MLGVAFGALILAVLTAHYFLVERPRRRAGAVGGPRPVAVLRGIGRQPRGIFLQPTFTWTRLLPDGEVQLGVHPLLVGLIGNVREHRLRQEGEQVTEGEPLVTLENAGRWLTVHSPIAGRITAVNPRASGDGTGDGSWDVARRGGSWLYRIEPEKLSDAVGGWLVGEHAVEWTRNAYRDIRDHLVGAASDRELGFALADGGELPAGVLADLDGDEWRTFQEAFLG